MTNQGFSQMASKSISTNGKKPMTRTHKEFYTGKNQVAESLLKEAFKPLISTKDGKARLTFIGAKHSMIQLKNKGEKPVIILVFSCLDTTHKNPANIQITADYRYSETNVLGRLMTIMGFTKPANSVTVIDPEDEFGTVEESINSDMVFDFLRSKCGSVWKAELESIMKRDNDGNKTLKSGLWTIKIDSLEPYITEGNQVYDQQEESAFDDVEIENTHDIQG